MPNRIKLAMSFYGNVEGEWVIKWLEFQAQISQFNAKHKNHYKGMVSMLGSCYVHMNCIQLVAKALEEPDWDYLLHLQQDMILPEGLMERVGTYTDPVVGVMYFGRVMHHQQAVPGRMGPKGFERLTDEEVEGMLDEPGLYPIGAVGMGCTAIRRDVFEKWDPKLWPWFQVPNEGQLGWGEDVWFCHQAAAQGFGVFVDTTLVAGHLGTWRSSDDTFRARLAHDRRLRALQADPDEDSQEEEAVG